MSFSAAGDPSAPSEDLFPFHQAGSKLPTHPLDIDYWCQSIQCTALPPTPPDTVSECSLTDYPDMAYGTGPWTSLPDSAWNLSPSAQEHSTWMQSPHGDWPAQDNLVANPDHCVSDVSPWIPFAGETVDFGFSPVLRYDSQNSQSIGHISEPDVQSLPPGLDLSFVAESLWEAPGSFVNPGPKTIPEHKAAASEIFSASSAGSPRSLSLVPTPDSCSAARSLLNVRQEQVQCPQRYPSDLTFSQGRPLLPRNTGPLFVDCGSQTSQLNPQRPSPTAQPHMVARSVSTSRGVPVEAPYPGDAFPVSAPTACGHSVQGYAPLRPVRNDSAGLSHSPSKQTRPQLQNFPHINQAVETSQVTISYASGPIMSYSGQAPVVDGQTDSQSASWQTGSSTSSSLTADGEEGRYRTHPLYSKGPHTDGLYHCPFQSDPSCQHKPTKLKCNYDKFVDSHLKPFRCKMEACSKQEFSSTACLLRHEREAHGMHGHGDRPHLCYYPGCERGIPGNGFPRRYNLFDHMKRVHDHKEEPSVAVGVSKSTGSRKPSGRKRRAVEDEEPSLRLSKMPMLQQPSPPMEPEAVQDSLGRSTNPSPTLRRRLDRPPSPCAAPTDHTRASNYHCANQSDVHSWQRGSGT